MRLIDAEEAYKVLTDYYHHKTEIQHKALKEAIERVPTVDIDAITESHERIGYDRGFSDGYAQATSEVKHGHWTDNGHIGKRRWCSVCGEDVTSSAPCIGFLPNAKVLWNYCPYCGAKNEAEE